MSLAKEIIAVKNALNQEIIKKTKIMKTTLYDITTAQREIMLAVQLAEGELTPELESLLEINEDELKDKAISYLTVISENEGFVDLIDKEIKRLQHLKKIKGNLVSRLKWNLLEAVKAFGNFEVGLHKFGTRKSQTVEIEDINHLPEKYIVTKVTQSADKMALKKALKEGTEIEGVKIVDHLNLKIN